MSEHIEALIERAKSGELPAASELLSQSYARIARRRRKASQGDCVVELATPPCTAADLAPSNPDDATVTHPRIEAP